MNENKQNIKICNFSKIKKVIFLIIIFVVVFLVGLFLSFFVSKKSASGIVYDNNQSGNNISSIYPDYNYYQDSRFIAPMDAVKKGEIAVVVDNIDLAKKYVTEISSKNNGEIYSTYTEYESPKEIRNGFIVLKVPADNFETVFSQLKSLSNRIIKEYSENIPKLNIYPYPVEIKDESFVVENQDQGENIKRDGIIEKIEVIDEKNISLDNEKNDSGYIKIIFIDYIKNEYSNRHNFFEFTTDDDIKNNLVAILAIKISVLFVLIGILLVVLNKIIKHYNDIRKIRRKALKVNEIKSKTRELLKTRKKVIKIAKR